MNGVIYMEGSGIRSRGYRGTHSTARFVLSACDKPLDIAVVLASSDTMKAHNYNTLKRSLSRLVDYFDVSENGTHFGFIHFGQDAVVDFTLSDAALYDPAKLKAAIIAVPYSPSLTRTDKALVAANQGLFSRARTDVSKVLLLVTDQATAGGSEPYSRVLQPLEVGH